MIKSKPEKKKLNLKKRLWKQNEGSSLDHENLCHGEEEGAL